MTETAENSSQNFFILAFQALTRREPFPWQRSAFQKLVQGKQPLTQLTLPTGTGKTSLIPIWIIALAWQSSLGNGFKLPRRLVWVVNRRVVVDQASQEAQDMAERLTYPEKEEDLARRNMLIMLSGHLGRISFLGSVDHKPMAVSTLRGQMADNAEWSLDPSRPAIIVGTVDMIGSRLLFSGYGLGKSRRPYHAGLIGHDAWIVLDEAHLTPAFAELIMSCRSIQSNKKTFSPFAVTLLSATQRGVQSQDPDTTIELTDDDKNNPVIGKRLSAIKNLQLIELADKDDDCKKLVELALTHRNTKSRVLVFVKSPKNAGAVNRLICKEAPECNVLVLTGTMRGYERDELAKNEIFAGFKSDPKRQAPDTTCFLVSTSAGEVGADLDADHMVSDLTTLDSMIQRFGRVNRLGLGAATIKIIVPAKLPDGNKEAKTLAYLKSLPQTSEGDYVVNPNALRNAPVEAFSEPPPIVPLAAHWLDMWSMTSIHDANWPDRPQIAPWLHGVERDIPETWFVWREDVKWLAGHTVKEDDPTKVFDVYGIRPHEQLRESSKEAAEKLVKLSQQRDNADMPAIVLRSDGSVVWRGALSDLANNVKNDVVNLNYATVILPPSAGGLAETGLFIPTEPKASDVADIGRLRRRFVVQMQDGVWSAIPMCDGDDSALYEAKSQKELISRIGRHTGLKAVACIKTTGEDENDDAVTASYLFYFTDSLSAAQSSAVSFVSREEQELNDHCTRVAEVAFDIATRIGLGKMAETLKLAGQMHDAGKSRSCWQHAIGNPVLTKPLAKSGHARFNQLFNGAYRHEFGSLVDAGKTLKQNKERELILHLVASHHGHARPHYRQSCFDKETALSICQKTALEAVQRFGFLQTVYGWWGLAWMEALLKAADAIVSSELDQGGHRD
jgi:CRISPR-associated endonuclease/helicase Cas3